MTEGLKWTVNEVPKSDDKHLELMSEENVKKANEFHRSFPQYSVTPLQNLSSLAKYLGVKNIFCKDESYRFGLNAFKVLGGSYAMGRYIAKELGRDHAHEDCGDDGHPCGQAERDDRRNGKHHMGRGRGRLSVRDHCK